MQKADVEVDCRVYDGVTHGFTVMCRRLDVARQALRVAGTALRAALSSRPLPAGLIQTSADPCSAVWGLVGLSTAGDVPRAASQRSRLDALSSLEKERNTAGPRGRTRGNAAVDKYRDDDRVTTQAETAVVRRQPVPRRQPPS